MLVSYSEPRAGSLRGVLLRTLTRGLPTVVDARMGRFIRVLGWTMIAIAALGVAVEFDNTVAGKAKNRAVGIVMILLFGAGGVRLLRSGKRTMEIMSTGGLTARQVEDAVLASARKNSGRVTVTDVAADTSLTFTEAKTALERLAIAGACETLMTDNGMIVYNFREIIHAHKKDDAS